MNDSNHYNNIKNNIKGLTILLIVILGLLLGLIVYLVYDKISSDKNGKNTPKVNDNNNTAQEIELDTGSVLVKSLLSMIRVNSDLCNGLVMV